MYLLQTMGIGHWVAGAVVLVLVLLAAKYLHRAFAWLLVRLYDIFIRDKNHVAPT